MPKAKREWTVGITIVTYDENHQRVETPLEDIPPDEWARRSDEILRRAMASIGYVPSGEHKETAQPERAAITA